METSNLFWWIGVVCFMVGFVWGALRAKDQPVPGLIYLTGLAAFDVSLIFDPNLSGADLWVPLVLMTALGVVFVALSWGAGHLRMCKECKEERNARKGADQGQVDGELPQGEGSEPGLR